MLKREKFEVGRLDICCS